MSSRPDLLYFSSHPRDTAGILGAASEIGVRISMLSGSMVGLQSGEITRQFGELLNNVFRMTCS